MGVIVSSEIIEDAEQCDSRRHIRERHSESDGVSHDFVWMAEPGENAEAGLADRASSLGAYLMEQELEENVAEAEGDEE